jgi:hypothetical protein
VLVLWFLLQSLELLYTYLLQIKQRPLLDRQLQLLLLLLLLLPPHLPNPLVPSNCHTWRIIPHGNMEIPTLVM